MILICSAWETETKYLSKDSRFKHSVQVETLGVGYLNAALRIRQIIERFREENHSVNYQRIIFLGTAGLYSLRNSLQIGDCVSVDATKLLHLGSFLGLAYTPNDTKHDLCSMPSLKSREGALCVNPDGDIVMSDQDFTLSKNFKKAFCMCSLEITKSKELSETIAEHYKNHNLVENMELYGVAKVCSDYQIPWNAFLGITNLTHENAHQQWQANHEQVSEELCNQFLKIQRLLLSH